MCRESINLRLNFKNKINTREKSDSDNLIVILYDTVFSVFHYLLKILQSEDFVIIYDYLGVSKDIKIMS